MKRVAHAIERMEFFDQLETDALEVELRRVMESPEHFFSEGDGKTAELRRFVVSTSAETIEFAWAEVDAFIAQLRSGEWESAHVKLQRAKVTPNVGFVVPNASDEGLALFIHKEEGSLQLQCRFRDVQISREFAERLHGSLRLSPKPIKFSRDIPQRLETQLLCDSMHMCNVCRDEGVIIHHIKPVEDGGKTIETNLIVLCLKHHRQAHSRSELSKNLTATHLFEYKRRHRLWVEARGSAIPVTDGTDESVSTGADVP
jgi:hypothetical protein